MRLGSCHSRKVHKKIKREAKVCVRAPKIRQKERRRRPQLFCLHLRAGYILANARREVEVEEGFVPQNEK